MVSGIGQSNNNWSLYPYSSGVDTSTEYQEQGQRNIFAPEANLTGASSVSGGSSVQSTNASTNESMVQRLDRVQGELTPDTRNAEQGQRLYCMA